MAAITTWHKSSFTRFVMVGVLNTLVGLGIIFLCYNVLYLGYWPSTFLGNTIGAIVSYSLNRTFTFRSKAGVLNSLWKFVLVILICYGFSYGIGLLLSKACASMFPAVPAVWIHNGAILIGNGIYMISNYLGHKYFTFRTKAQMGN